MAQTVICGTSGSVDLGSSRGARIASFSIDLGHAVYDATGFSSGGARQNNTGLKSCSGTAAGWLTKGTATDTPDYTGLTVCDQGASITLNCDSGCSYTFVANITNIRIDSSVDDNARIVFSFVSNGTITESWTTS